MTSHRFLIRFALAVTLLVRLAYALDPGEARPVSVDPESAQPWQESRDEALLCYHTGAAYYMKVPHPSYGNPQPYFQRITPGASGHVEGIQFRYYNSFGNNHFHHGAVEFGLHRQTAGLPGLPEMTISAVTDTIGNAIVDYPLADEFSFEAGEVFYLSLSYFPESPQDTIAMVLADIGQYTGHSFFFLDDQIMWWGNNTGTPYGDMHFCAQTWLNDEEAVAHFPWPRIDLGLSPENMGNLVRIPLTNQGTAALVIHQLSVDHPDWTVLADGPDSLQSADTTIIQIEWQPQNGDTLSLANLHLETNAINMAESDIEVRAGSSSAELLIADWTEWGVRSLQLADTGQVSNPWALYSGLARPGPFAGHGFSLNAPDVQDLLALFPFDLPAESWIELRWTQLQRRIADMQHHALVWRGAEHEDWQELAEPDLSQDPWTGEENTWHMTPRLMLGPIPPTEGFELGFLFSGSFPQDSWYIDDIELVLHHALIAPQVSIRPWGTGIKLSWAEVEDADRYLVEALEDGHATASWWTEANSWIRMGELRRSTGQYRVTAFNSFTPPLENRLQQNGGRRWSGKDARSVSRVLQVSSDDTCLPD
jgi:hypothetical protein